MPTRLWSAHREDRGFGLIVGEALAVWEFGRTMYRLLTVAVILLWLGAMSALFVRDVWPSWSAQDAPPMRAEDLADLLRRQEQYGLFKVTRESEPAVRVGTAWAHLHPAGDGSAIRSTVLVHGLPMAPPLRIETETVFDDHGGLDSFWLRVLGIPMTRVFVRGERHGIYFPCEIHLGPIHRQANLEMSASRLIGDSLRPFSVLPTLQVGQSWRMQLLDPLAAALARKVQFRSLVARVTGKETIEHRGEQVECFVVETAPQQVKAWVNSHGQVLLQEVEMPGLGRLLVREEPYDEGLRAQARRTVHDKSEDGDDTDDGWR
ncbi:MAG: hypothetical protein GXY55_10695 [Phycisphaerae bacterium]|nr:hypothetical protein [Phycisphaerae bacterium]